MCVDGGIFFFGGCPVAEPWCRDRNLSCCTDVTHEHSFLLASVPLSCKLLKSSFNNLSTM